MQQTVLSTKASGSRGMHMSRHLGGHTCACSDALAVQEDPPSPAVRPRPIHGMGRPARCRANGHTGWHRRRQTTLAHTARRRASESSTSSSSPSSSSSPNIPSQESSSLSAKPEGSPAVRQTSVNVREGRRTRRGWSRRRVHARRHGGDGCAARARGSARVAARRAGGGVSGWSQRAPFESSAASPDRSSI
jgi:hypothetical protein